MPLKRVFLDNEEKELLEEMSGLKLHLRNTFGQNQATIDNLLEQGKQNALVYLERHKLGQKLSMFEENNLFKAVVNLQKNLGLKKLPRRIECYDISHLSGTFVYGSMVVFVDGRPAKSLYRLFKCKEQNNDFENHREVLIRRVKRFLEGEKELQNLETDELGNSQQTQNPWQLPDLIIVDGGKGQLSSDWQVLVDFDLTEKVEMCALAKKEEEVFLPSQSDSVLLEGETRFLIQRIRDEAHRFAITNNRRARLKTADKSELDAIAGIGPKTKQKLLSVFGSTKGLVEALDHNFELVYELVGKSTANKLKKHFGI